MNFYARVLRRAFRNIASFREGESWILSAAIRCHKGERRAEDSQTAVRSVHDINFIFFNFSYSALQSSLETRFVQKSTRIVRRSSHIESISM
jgi:hypothetical protein